MASHYVLVDEDDIIAGLHHLSEDKILFERINQAWIPVPDNHFGFNKFEISYVSEDFISVFDFEKLAGRAISNDDIKEFLETTVTSIESTGSLSSETDESIPLTDLTWTVKPPSPSSIRSMAPVDGIFLVNAESVIELFDSREGEILRNRLGAGRSKTLDEIGQRFGITRERVRQLESGVKTKLDVREIHRLVEHCVFKSSFFMQPIQLMKIYPILDIRFAHNVSVLDILVATEKIKKFQFGTRTWFGFEVDRVSVNGNRELSLQDYVSMLRDQPESKDNVQSVLKRIGIRGNYLNEFLEDHGLMIWNGYVCSASLTLAEFVIHELNKAEQPVHIDHLVETLNGRWTKATLINLLGVDERFTRTDRNFYGLTSWELRPYRGIKNEISALVNDRGPLPVNFVVETLLSWFNEISEYSIRLYANTSPLVTRGGVVQFEEDNNRELKPLSQLNNVSLRRVFRTSTGFAIRIEVNADHLRGSGWATSQAVASIIGLQFGNIWERSFENSKAVLRINNLRAQIEFGSIRTALEEVGAEINDHFMIFFEGTEGNISSVWFELIPRENLPSDPVLKALKLAAVEGNIEDPLLGICAALGLQDASHDDVLEVVQARRDTVLASALLQWDLDE